MPFLAIDLEPITLNEEGTWIESFREGSYKHPVFGDLNFTSDRLKRFADNITNRVRGIDLAIDYNHRTDQEAAGWIKDAEYRDGVLHLLVEWTKTAAEKIKNREYRYFSPDYRDTWKDANGVEHQDVLFGGGLTNRPFLKDLNPINLSELGEKMDLREQLIQKLGLPADATDEQITEALDKKNSPTIDWDKMKVEKVDDSNYRVTFDGIDGEGSVKVEAPQPATTGGQMSEDTLKQLAEKDPAIAHLLAERENDRKRLEALEASNRLSEANVRLSELDESSDKFRLPPSVKNTLRDVLVGGNKQFGDKVIDAFKTVLKDGLVPVGQTRDGQPPKGEKTGDVVRQFTEAVDELMKNDDKLSYTDAVVQFAEENPKVYSDYQKALRENAEVS